MPGKVLHSQSQQYLLNVVEYFEKDKENKGPLLPVQDAIERAAQAFKVGISTVNRVTRRVYEAHTSGTRVTTPRKRRPKLKQIRYTIDCFTVDAIRREIYDMYSERQHITIATLHESLIKKDVISFGSTTLYKVLCDIGFKYRTDDNRRSLCEKNYIVEQRISFLRKYRMNKATDQLAVIFLDETWIFGRGSQRRSWQDESVLSVKNKAGGAGKKVHPWTEAQLQQFLREHNVAFDVEMFKPELYSLANVLRLPPYHCQFNAIEEVWSQCKRYYDNHVGRDGFGDAQVTAIVAVPRQQLDNTTIAQCGDARPITDNLTTGLLRGIKRQMAATTKGLLRSVAMPGRLLII
ncbi:hypothetical protein CBL_08471 [Carabus blaptoides fortunei]